VLVLGLSEFLDYDYEDDDENDRKPAFFPMRSNILSFPLSR